MTKRRIFSLLGLVFVLALVALPVAADTTAYPDPGTGSTTTELANKTANPASVSIFYYDSTGTSINGPTPTIPGNGSVMIDPASSQLPQGFNGAGVASSNQPLAAVVQTDYTGGTGDGYQTGFYAGVAQGSSKICFPSLWKQSTQISSFAVQNTGTSSVAVKINYKGRDGADQGTFDDNIPVGAQHTYDLATPGGAMPNLPDPWAGAASVTVNGAGTVAGVGTTAYAGRYTDYNAIDCATVSGATTLVIPSQFRQFSPGPVFTLWSAINIQNLSNSTANVTIKYINRANPADILSLNKTIAPLSAIGLNTNTGGDYPASTFSPLDVTPTWAGTAQVISDQPVVGTVITQWKRSAGTDGAFYGSVSSTGGATKWFVPNEKRVLSGATFQKYSATLIQNLGTSAADVTITYYNRSGTSVLTFANESIAAGAGLGLNTRTGGDKPASAFDPLGTSYEGHTVVTSNNGQPLAVVLNGVVNSPSQGSAATNAVPQ